MYQPIDGDGKKSKRGKEPSSVLDELAAAGGGQRTVSFFSSLPQWFCSLWEKKPTSSVTTNPATPLLGNNPKK